MRIVYLLRFYLTTVLVFIVAKVAFMLFNRAEHAFGMGDVWQVLVHGLSLDLSTALYFLIVPFLLTIASIWVRIPRWLFIVYDGLVAVIFALAFVADTSLYPFWGFKLDASCLQYLETPTEAMASVSSWYLVLRVLAFFAVAAGIFFCYSAHQASPRPRPLPLKGRGPETLLYLLFIPFFVIGIRGGLDESTTNIGQVYYSQNQFLNHSAVNPLFSFFSSFEKTASEIPDYQFMTDEECRQTMSGLYFTDSSDTDTLLTTQQPNIVVILMESCGAIFTGLEGRADVMPHLERLMQEGVSFDSCYANSWRTDRGTVCTYSGYPSFPVSSVMKMPAKSRLLPGLARTLAREGYETSYLYGGDINFTNMRSYLVSTGFERLMWKKDFSSDEQKSAEWGVRDDIMFGEVARQIFDYSTKGKPFFIGFSTLSSHQPWDVPDRVKDGSERTKDGGGKWLPNGDEILNAFCYLDHCIGTFIDSLRHTSAWDSLLVILLPDHGIDYEKITVEDVRHNHIPFVWTGGAVKSPRRIGTICNQTDLAATLLGQLGIAHDEFRFSRDVMSKGYTYPFAVHTYNNGIAMKDSTGFAMFDLNANRIIVDMSCDSEQLIHKGKAILQTAAQDVNNL